MLLLKNLNTLFNKNKTFYTKKQIKRNKLEIYIKELDFSKDITVFNGIFQIIADIKNINITSRMMKKNYMNIMSVIKKQVIILYC